MSHCIQQGLCPTHTHRITEGDQQGLCPTHTHTHRITEVDSDARSRLPAGRVYIQAVVGNTQNSERLIIGPN